MKWFIAFAIIASCLALSLAAVWTTGINRGPRTPVEIDHLSQAMQAHKEEATQFPPCLADTDPRQRKERFMQHIQANWINAEEYKPTVAAYDETNRKVRHVWKHHFVKPDGSVDLLNLDNLDPAEALVFWLGGFPTPVDPATKKPIATRKLFGFHRDSDDPFKRDTSHVEELEPFRHRTEPRFQFDPGRLVDNDGDGWLEYHPYPVGEPNRNAPYVYFDAASYTASTLNRKTTGSVYYPHDAKLAREWGVTVPMPLYFDATGSNPTRWANDRSFQILCAGLDGKYGPPTPRLVVFPSLDTFDAADNYQKPHAVDDTELDNLTNLSRSALEQARNESEQ